MRYWFDTEFIEDGKTIDLISIGIVAEDGREFYAESSEADLSKASLWVQENVLPHLVHVSHGDHPGEPLEGFPPGCPWMRRSVIAAKIRQFCDPTVYGEPVIWAHYADYDWVALCQLFGRMLDLPDGWPMYCRDLKQWADEYGVRISGEIGEPEDEHHALADARWNRQAWEFMHELEMQPR